MSNDMRIKEALAQLDAGKFCFRMSDCISNHIAAQAQQIDALTALYDQDRFEIMKRDLHIHLLEQELTYLKGVLRGALQIRQLMRKAIKTATVAKEKFFTTAGSPARWSASEIKTKITATIESLGLLIEKDLNGPLLPIRALANFLEKFTSELYSKIKAAA